jgi:3-phenylpropionate/trans-cinnamate dioxygenase ferredoxin subunit
MTEQPKGELVCNASEIQLKQALRILIDDYPVAIVKDSMGEIHAIGDTCSHADISLSEGEVEGCLIECWGHGSQFDLRSGEPLQLPAYDPGPVFAVTIEGDEVYVDGTNVLNGAEAPNFSSLPAAGTRTNKLFDEKTHHAGGHGAEENKTHVYS